MPCKAKCSLPYSHWFSSKGLLRPPLQLHSWGKRFPLSHLTPACLIYHKIKKTLSVLTAQPRAQGAKKEVRKGVLQPCGYSISSSSWRTTGEGGELHLCSLSLKHRSCSAQPRTGLGIYKSTTPCAQGTHGHDSKASGQL